MLWSKPAIGVGTCCSGNIGGAVGGHHIRVGPRASGGRQSRKYGGGEWILGEEIFILPQDPREGFSTHDHQDCRDHLANRHPGIVRPELVATNIWAGLLLRPGYSNRYCQRSRLSAFATCILFCFYNANSDWDARKSEFENSSKLTNAVLLNSD